MNARSPDAAETAAKATAQAHRLSQDACGLLLQLSARGVGTLPPAASAPLEAALEALGSLGAAGVAGLCAVLDHLFALPESARSRLEERCTGDWRMAAIEALATSGATAPDALAAGYDACAHAEARDLLCEAAGKVQGRRPVLIDLMHRHLARNPFVAGLSFADCCETQALPALFAQLDVELERAKRPVCDVVHVGLIALHVEGLAEAIKTLGGELPAPLVKDVLEVKRRSQPPGAPWRKAEAPMHP